MIQTIKICKNIKLKSETRFGARKTFGQLLLFLCINTQLQPSSLIVRNDSMIKLSFLSPLLEEGTKYQLAVKI